MGSYRDGLTGQAGARPDDTPGARSFRQLTDGAVTCLRAYRAAAAVLPDAIVIVVPMVIEKIIRKMVFPLIQQRYVHLLLNMPVVNKKIKARILQQVGDFVMRGGEAGV